MKVVKEEKPDELDYLVRPEQKPGSDMNLGSEQRAGSEQRSGSVGTPGMEQRAAGTPGTEREPGTSVQTVLVEREPRKEYIHSFGHQTDSIPQVY